ncbi:MAG: hypothetical protein HY547_03530 [Elusimicrobia bacterium]|nr:hypothetical protein [Elusimicrobiota bacterium]
MAQREEQKANSLGGNFFPGRMFRHSPFVSRFLWIFIFMTSDFGLRTLDVSASGSAGTYAGTFLISPSGVRSMAMGDAGAALPHGSNGAQYNPATLSRSHSADLSFSRQTLVLDETQSFLGYAQPLDFRGLNELGGVTAFTTLRYVDHGYITVNLLNSDGSLSYTGETQAGRDLAWGIGYAETFLRGGFGGKSLGEGIHSIGMMIHGIQSNLLSQYTAYAAAVSAGYFAYYPRLAVGLSVANVGTKLKYINSGDPLPVSARAGFALPRKITSGIGYILAYDAIYEERAFHHRSGVELNLGPIFSLRGGWRFEPESYRGGPTFGFGLNAGRLFVDYAYGWYGDLQETHRVLLGLKFSHHRLR